MRAGWLIRRLCAMSPGEIGYRVRVKARASYERAGLGLARDLCPEGVTGRAWCQLPRAVDLAPYGSEADRILRGVYRFFALDDARLGFPPNWNQCPKTHVVAPRSFGKSINYRDPGVVGDIKYLWELNRHLELVTLAQAWHLSRDPRYGAGCVAFLESWFAQCAYPYGTQWTNSLEVAIRLVNWAIAWQLLGGDNAQVFYGADGQDFRGRWLASIHQHCHYIAHYLSRFSSANNHLLGELMGLFVGAVTWPLWPASHTWRQLAHVEFSNEFLKQNTSDGVNREQAFWYQHEVADMALLCLLTGQANGITFRREVWQRLHAMLDFLAAVMDVSGHVPMVGDSDDAVMVRFAPASGFNVYRSLLATGAVLFKDPRLAAKAQVFDDKSTWLLGDEAGTSFCDLQRSKAALPAPAHSFPEGGYSVLGSNLDSAREIRIVADAGPLGYLSLAAHGHADALAFTLSVHGTEILIDPGTYAYHTNRAWRDYFRGTSAHNTLRIDGTNQSTIAGNFMWRQHAVVGGVTYRSASSEDALLASHSGYRRLADPVTHRRRITLDKLARTITVTDELLCRGQHEVEIYWHVSRECEVDIANGVAIARHYETIVRITMPDIGWLPQGYRGSLDPILGWASTGLDKKEPCDTIVWSGEVSGETTLTTLFHLSGPKFD